MKKGPSRPLIKLPVEHIASVDGAQVDQDEMQRFTAGFMLRAVVVKSTETASGVTSNEFLSSLMYRRQCPWFGGFLFH